ncbi:LAFA_0E18690g1_1 [Lachancea sp. 'fantastica']|nr:LAFA_0E18690g1_1 [Lachancea sp. 'fantastica']
MKRLVTFPGQGSPVLGHVLNKYLAQRSQIFSFNRSGGLTDLGTLVAQIEQKPADPASIAACSFLLYRAFTENKQNLKKDTSSGETVFLGHSLGELSCLGAGNELFTLHQSMQIATYRNKLMLQAAGALEYGMWAISVPRARDLVGEIRNCIPIESSLALANVNTAQQCVVTGEEKDFELWEPSLRHAISGRCKITRLGNPYGIPFHNERVLAPIDEPLLEYMWQILKSQGLGSQKLLNHEVISNYTGKRVRSVSEALESFAKSSCNVVEFVKCCEKVNQLNITEAVHIGPGTHIAKLVARNCHIPETQTWDEYMGKT